MPLSSCSCMSHYWHLQSPTVKYFERLFSALNAAELWLPGIDSSDTDKWSGSSEIHLFIIFQLEITFL